MTVRPRPVPSDSNTDPGVTGAGDSDPTLATPARSPTSLSARLAPGAIVAGRYRLVGLLGRGGLGEVYSIALVVALAFFGFYAARAGQPLLGKLEI